MAFVATKRRIARPRGCRGAFTFIEVLATMALLAIVLPAVMSGISLCLSTARFARQQSQASALGQGKLAQLVAEGQWQHAGLTGDYGTQWPEYRWTAEVSDWDGSVVREVDVITSWRQGNKDRSVTLSTLVYTGVSE